MWCIGTVKKGERDRNSNDSVFLDTEDRPPKDYEKVYPDPNTEDTVMGSLVYCIHLKKGCKWMDEFRKLQGHLNTCKYDAIPCTNQCAAMIPRLLMEDHLFYTCPKRRTRCKFCSREYSGEILEGHMSSCQYEPVFCENKCGLKILRRFVTTHQMNECAKRLVACRHCQKEFVYDTLKNHTTKCPRYPVPCPNHCELSKVPREDMEVHLNDHCPSVALYCVFRDMGCKFKGSRFALDLHMESSTNVHLDLMSGLVLKQQHQITSLRNVFQNLTLNTSGILLWRVSDYTQKMSEAKSRKSYEISSFPFYTSQYGYKLMATLFLNGNGAGEGSHLSVYIKILPGEYDSLLSWPFSHTVSFTLHDQAASPENACHIVESFVPDPSWKNFQRPSKEPDSLGYGFPRFVSHETLKKLNYVKDDTLFIKVKANSSKIAEV